VSTFQYQPELLARYPAIVGGIILGHGLQNGPTSAAIQEAYLSEQRHVLERIGQTSLSQLPSLSAWRSAFRGFGVDPTQYRGAAEALIRRLTKKGDIPSINQLVDIGNMISIRYALPVSVIDTRAIQGALTARFASGQERYTILGQSEVDHPEPGEVIFVDDSDLVFTRRWCWRQSEDSAAQDDTTSIIVTIEALHAGGAKEVATALRDMHTLLQIHAGGSYLTNILDAKHPVLSDEAI
jgi:DNA/RNA-binding domain of Phe-tRNA-synthetase-like protein